MERNPITSEIERWLANLEPETRVRAMTLLSFAYRELRYDLEWERKIVLVQREISRSIRSTKERAAQTTGASR
jgi:hypothetical protein